MICTTAVAVQSYQFRDYCAHFNYVLSKLLLYTFVENDKIMID